jgi:acyl dehydratase
MAPRAFTLDDQLAFAELSGDRNPLHLDPLLARRLLFGRQVVHGLHLLLWALDECLKTRAQPLELSSLRADFRAGIGLGQTVDGARTGRGEAAADIRLETDAAPVAWIRAGWRPSARHAAEALPQPPRAAATCRELTAGEAEAAAGRLPLHLDGELAARLFPTLVRLLPPLQLAAILATTRLVGMECPGLHSIFAGLELEFAPERGRAPELSYRAAGGNPRLGLILLEVGAPGMRGRIKAFHRPRPRGQASFEDLRRGVGPGEFAQQRALIVGGSRGLGEVAAKLLAAGGAETIVTYHRGERDAQRVVADIVALGGRAACRPWNVLEPAPGLPGAPGEPAQPLYLYYFATPFIFGGVKGAFSAERFRTFSEYYVAGFQRAAQALAASGLRRIFYPSSVAVDEPPADMGEYAAAKSAGEALCDVLQKTQPGLVVHRPRLPRLATDQTASLLPLGDRDPAPIILTHLRVLRDLNPL